VNTVPHSHSGVSARGAGNVIFLRRQPLSFISFVRWRLLLATSALDVKSFHIRSLDGSSVTLIPSCQCCPACYLLGTTATTTRGLLNMSRSCRFRPTYSSLSTVAYGKRYDGSVCVSLTYCNDGGVWYFDAANLATEHLCRVAVDVPRQRSVKACCSGRPTAAERQGVLQWTSHGRGASRRVAVDVPRQRSVKACYSGRPTAEERRGVFQWTSHGRGAAPFDGPSIR